MDILANLRLSRKINICQLLRYKHCLLSTELEEMEITLPFQTIKESLNRIFTVTSFQLTHSLRKPNILISFIYFVAEKQDIRGKKHGFNGENKYISKGTVISIESVRFI